MKKERYMKFFIVNKDDKWIETFTYDYNINGVRQTVLLLAPPYCGTLYKESTENWKSNKGNRNEKEKRN